MIKILFVCLGNICRSPMAEFIMKDMVARAGLTDEIYVESAATSYEEEGNDMYPPARRKLDREGVPYSKRRARRITASDYEIFDMIIAMEKRNIFGIMRVIEKDPDHKVRTLLDRDIADPWYTGDFDRTYDDLTEGCAALLNELRAITNNSRKDTSSR